ncbi:MAG: ABC transporter ATP-binding protein [Clostridia bacterium]|nr:ABC transporter ATP-binding protein [Clostridia bacterium]
MIKVSHLTKQYGSITALRDVSFAVKKGEVVGFLGPNGAGKTTAMNIITGYLSSTSGSVSIDGYDILEEPTEAKKRIGYLPEVPPLYPDMTVNEYLDFIYALKGAWQKKAAHFKEICELTRIEAVRGRLIKNLSKGYRQRVGIAQALVGNPPVLILDEPTVGLDPRQIVETRTLVKQLGEDHTVIFSSHLLGEVQAVCGRVIVLNNGRLVADSQSDSLGQRLGGHEITLKAAGSESDVKALLNTLKCVRRFEKNGAEDGEKIQTFLVQLDGSENAREEIFYAFAARKLPIVEMRTAEYSLEDIFLSLVGQNPKESEKEAASK